MLHAKCLCIVNCGRQREVPYINSLDFNPAPSHVDDNDDDNNNDDDNDNGNDDDDDRNGDDDDNGRDGGGGSGDNDHTEILKNQVIGITQVTQTLSKTDN